jgi:hypothetical protein
MINIIPIQRGTYLHPNDVRAGEPLARVVRADASAKPRRQRKPSIRALLAQAEKAGRHVQSMTMPDGTVLTFGEPEAASSNPWLDDLAARRAKR